MYAERTKAKYGVVDDTTKRILEVYVPTFSVCALLAVTGWITSDAIAVISGVDDDDDVNVIFLFAFASANFIVDAISSYLFYTRRDNVLVTEQLRTFSLERMSMDWKARPLMPNLNMLSALTHVGSDTMRTLSVFIAAMIASAGHQNSAKCDAWAAVVVTITIVIAVIPLCKEIYKAAIGAEEAAPAAKQPAKSVAV